MESASSGPRPSLHNRTRMSDTSGNWPSGCPEKYPWIGGDESFDRWAAEWADYTDEQQEDTSSRDPTLRNMEAVNRDLIAVNRGLTEDNQNLTQRNMELSLRNKDLNARNMDLMGRNMGLGEQLHSVEDNVARLEEELAGEASMNQELTARVSSLSTYMVKLWIELASAKGREKRAWTVVIMMAFFYLFALMRK